MVAANAGARASAGNRAGIVGRPIREVLPELEGQQIFEMMEEAYAAGRVVAATDRRVLVDRDGDGRLEEGFFTYTFVPTFSDDGRPGDWSSTLWRRPRRRCERRQQNAPRRCRGSGCSTRPRSCWSCSAACCPGACRCCRGCRWPRSIEWPATSWQPVGTGMTPRCLPDGRVALVVGDVVGHGARAAGAMGQLRAVLSDALLEGRDPAEALRRVNRFATRDASTRAATVCVVVVETDGSAMVGSHAHPLPLIVGSDGTTRRLPAVGSAPLGTGSGNVVWQPFRLDVGEMLLLFTDGLVERPDRSITDGMKSLVATVAAARRDAGENALHPATSLPVTPVERVATLVIERMAFLGDGYADDVTVLVAQHRLPVPPLSLDIEATLGALRTARRTLTWWLDELGADPDDADALVYATGEAIANTVQHAYRGRPADAARPVRMRAWLSDSGEGLVEIADEGRWQPAPPGASDGGRGLLMMRELCDAVEISHPPAAATGTTVRLTHRLRRPVTIGLPGPQPVRAARADQLIVEVDEDTGHAVVAGPIDMATAAETTPDAAARHPGRRPGTDPRPVGRHGAVQRRRPAAARPRGHRARAVLAAVPGRPAHQVLQLVGLDDHLVNADPPSLG